ncbi:paraquat-inducible protein A [Congregibacter brevis]|uniref:Paraquat-inducible protein A n=1 Tax=Congregibacter brevis TaxID=3081201 RepID=A0ABZ0IIK9_9GAMM|nr:paraquat-inducible protein A [Congregibacter sp. IMCC45268]
MTTGVRFFGLALILMSLALLYPGITQPVLTLSGELEKSELADFGIDLIAGEGGNSQTRDMLNAMARMMGLDQIEGRVEAYRSTRSILGMSEELASNGNLLVAVMIVSFSVVIPVLKLLFQACALLLPANSARRLLKLNAALGKWSMADVFVMAMLIAFMAGRASNHVGELLIMDAQLEQGFWFFLAYCLFAIAAGGLLNFVAARQSASEELPKQNLI